MNILDQRALNKSANDKVATDKAYDKAWAIARESTLRLSVDRFWNIMETFRSDILDVSKYDVSRYACDELFRRCVTKDLGGVTFDELVSFIENWQAVTAALHETLFDIVTDKGDDGYNDLCDGLPLIGRRGVAFLLALDDTEANERIISEIKNRRPSGKCMSTWLKLIWDGKNYWRMHLEDEAKSRYPHQATNHTPQLETLV